MKRFFNVMLEVSLSGVFKKNLKKVKFFQQTLTSKAALPLPIEFSFQKAIWSGYPGSSLIFLSADMLDTDHPIPL